MKKTITVFVLLFFALLSSAYAGPTSYENSNPVNSLESTSPNDTENENATLIVDFLASPVSGIAPLEVKFEDNSSTSTIAWEWDFNSDGVVDSTEKNPVYEFTSPGSYNVTFGAGNGNIWNNTTKINYILVGEKPVANFTATPRNGTIPLTVKFTDGSTGNVTSWLWNFGDGKTSTAQNPEHIYSESGIYDVNLKVSNAFESDTQKKQTFINVSSVPVPLPVANFQPSVTSGEVPLKVQFKDTSTGSITSWLWNFGDGKTSTYVNPVHTYSQAGTYTVKLTVTGESGSSALEKPSLINVSSTDSEDPVNPTDPTDPTNPTNPTGPTDPTNPTDPTEPTNPTNPTNPTDPTDTNDTTNTTDPVNPAAPVDPPITDSLTADFTSDITSGKAPLTVQFNDLSTGSPTAWEWDFNSDGQVDSNEQNPVFEYKDPGTYTVTLKAGNGSSWDDIVKTSYITVTDGFQADFTATPREGGIPLTVQFTDMSTGNATSWLWDFGDGNISTSQNPSHTYYETGYYSVILNVSNAYEYSVTTWDNYIKVTDGDESSGGSGGSSFTGTTMGGGASPEPVSNVETQEQAQKYIAAGNHITFDFLQAATYIDSVEFDAKKTLGKTTATVEQLKGRSVLTPIEPGGIIYKYLNIWVGNEGFADPRNIENAFVRFRVSRSGLTENETAESVVLQRYSEGKWNVLPTSKTGEDDQYIYYQASTPGFSPFAITFGSAQPIGTITNQTLNLTLPVIGNSQGNQTTIGRAPGLYENKDLSGATSKIRFLVVFMVVLLIGLAIREKRK